MAFLGLDTQSLGLELDLELVSLDLGLDLRHECKDLLVTCNTITLSHLWK